MKLIIACDPEGGIGYQGKLPWSKIEGNLPRFKELTSGKIIVMGRNTWESLPNKPLPNRISVVVTSRDIPGITTINRLPEKGHMDLSDVWLIGGAKLISSAWHLVDEVYLSKTFVKYTCDVFIDLMKLEREFTCWFKENHSDHFFEIWKRNETVSRITTRYLRQRRRKR